MGFCQYVDLCFHASSLPCLHAFWHAIPTPFIVSCEYYYVQTAESRYTELERNCIDAEGLVGIVLSGLLARLLHKAAHPLASIAITNPSTKVFDSPLVSRCFCHLLNLFARYKRKTFLSKLSILSKTQTKSLLVSRIVRLTLVAYLFIPTWLSFSHEKLAHSQEVGVST